MFVKKIDVKEFQIGIINLNAYDCIINTVLIILPL